MENITRPPSIGAVQELIRCTARYSLSPSDQCSYGPLETHELFNNAPEVPRLPWQETVIRRFLLSRMGFVGIAGIAADWNLSSREAIHQMDLGSLHLARGGLMGPHVYTDDWEQNPGYMIYMRRGVLAPNHHVETRE